MDYKEKIMSIKKVFITGASGYIGKALIPELLKRGHSVKALVRPGLENKINPGCEIIVGNPLEENSFSSKIFPSDTFIQLVGVPHPSPSKAELFRKIDLISAKASIYAAKKNDITHFIYISVAQPAPIMKTYIEVRAEVENLIAENGLCATIFRPWYILGPGHRWPYLFLPVYLFLKSIPSTRESARRLDLIPLRKMIHAIIYFVENPSQGINIIEAPFIKDLKD